MTWRRRPLRRTRSDPVGPGRNLGRGELRGVRDDRDAGLPPLVLGQFPRLDGRLVGLLVGMVRLLRVLRLGAVPAVRIGLDPQGAGVAQVGEHVLQQREHPPEQLRQDGGQLAVPLGMDVVDVRGEDGLAPVADVHVRGEPLEALRELVLRVGVRRVPPGPLGRPAHLPHQAEQRGVHQVEDLPAGAGMPVPLLLGDVLQDPDRRAQPRPEVLADQGVRLPDAVDGGHLGAGGAVPQRRVVGEFGEDVADLRLGEALVERLTGPPGHDARVARLVGPSGLLPYVRAAPCHLDLPQGPGRRERQGAGGVEGQRECGRGGQCSRSSGRWARCREDYVSAPTRRTRPRTGPPPDPRPCPRPRPGSQGEGRCPRRRGRGSRSGRAAGPRRRPGR